MRTRLSYQVVIRDAEPTRRQLVLAAAATTALGLAGCTGSSGAGGGEDSSDSDGDSQEDHVGHGDSLEGPSASATVTMETADDGTHFEPHVVWVEQGGTVTWELESGSHTTTAYSEAVDRPARIPEEAAGWDSGTLSEAGATFEHTFETAGVYDYFCVPHESTGMLGSVIVGEPQPEGQPGLEPPQDDLPGEAKTKIESLNERTVAVLEGGENNEESGHDTESESGHDH